MKVQVSTKKKTDFARNSQRQRYSVQRVFFTFLPPPPPPMQNNPSQICPKTFVPREKHFLEKSILCFRGGEKNAFLKSKILRYVQNLQWT